MPNWQFIDEKVWPEKPYGRMKTDQTESEVPREPVAWQVLCTVHLVEGNWWTR